MVDGDSVKDRASVAVAEIGKVLNGLVQSKNLAYSVKEVDGFVVCVVSPFEAVVKFVPESAGTGPATVSRVKVKAPLAKVLEDLLEDTVQAAAKGEGFPEGVK